MKIASQNKLFSKSTHKSLLRFCSARASRPAQGIFQRLIVVLQFFIK